MEIAVQADANEQLKIYDSPLSQVELILLKEQLRKEQEQLIKEQEQLKIEQEQLKKDQEQLILHQKELEAAQNELKKAQEKLKNDQKEFKKEQEKIDIQNKQNKLKTEITSKNYIDYLKKLGYYKNVYKNDEALNIRNTILLFQSNHNMTVTGTWDEATKQMLIKRLVSPTFTYLDTIKSAPTKGKWIVVNKTKKTLTLYEGTKVLKKYAVAVGNPASLTKSGKFIVNMKIENPDWGGGGFAKPVKSGLPENPLGSRWIGINRTDGSYGIHGTNSFYSIGKYISHGCIRMQNYCVEELFPLVPLKADVWVGTQDELIKWGVTQNPFEIQSSIK
ncbi:L,D-transpeptidase family protein [Ruminiclostridium herbifermentans]|uniref:L,D-transpeptidase family protein n=2 Tax=Ruminiclostridium herbifermentans TaxID=2488810 RepID=A0A4V6ENG1_9FIRM|nr:L,D-transpeptidase family protein [Ruminiclostridium herbifermentans]